MPWYQKTVKSGNVTEIYQYFSIRKRGKDYLPRSIKMNETPEEKQAINIREARLKCTRLINANFTKQDMFVRLSYRGTVDYETAAKEFKNFMRRLRHYNKKNNLPNLKYISVIGKDRGKHHHHTVMNFTDINVLKTLWGKGGIYFTNLYSEDYEDLANYITNQTVRVENGKRWSQSRNLKKPDIKVKELKKESRTGPNVPKGHYLLESNCYVTSLGHRTWYIKTVKQDVDCLKGG